MDLRKLFMAFTTLYIPLVSAAIEPKVEESAYVEFLWSPTPPGAIARQVTLGLVFDGRQRHQICVASRRSSIPKGGLRIEGLDASGKLAFVQKDGGFRGDKRCYNLPLNLPGAAGHWLFNIYVSGTLRAVKEIEVVDDISNASFHAPSTTPYVLGRPNYDPSLPPEEFIGRLVWIMYINKDGGVVKVEVETAEGIGVVMKERAIAAGYISRFPPDPSRVEGQETYRRELIFAPD